MCVCVYICIYIYIYIYNIYIKRESEREGAAIGLDVTPAHFVDDEEVHTDR